MKKIFSTLVLLSVFGLVAHATMSSNVVNQASHILAKKLKVDAEVAKEAIRNSKKVTIDDEIYNSVKIGKDSVLIGNGGVLLLGSITAGSIKNKVELDKHSVVIGNVGVVTH